MKNQLEPVRKSVTTSSFRFSSLGINLIRILALLLVIAITVYVYDIRSRIQDFAAYGYPGIFLVALLSNATVFIPAPGVAVVFAMGSLLSPFAVGFIAGTGGALGELSGYLAGFGGQGIIERTAIYERIHPWVLKYGGWAILVFAAIPNPFFDLAGVAAGVTKMPIWEFLLFCWFGQIIKMSLFAFAGAYSIGWLSGLLH